MLGKNKPAEVDRPNLLERVFAAGCTRLAVISLHAGAGARTVVESMALEFHRRGIPTGVTRAPRLRFESDDAAQLVPRIRLPEGTIVATTASLAGEAEGLEPLETVHGVTVLGELGLYRLTAAGEVAIYGPDDPESMGTVLAALERWSGGLVLVDGAWERRGFAAPGLAQAMVLAVGAGYSGTPERSAAALRFAVEILRLPECDGPASRAWRNALADRGPVVLDALGQELGRLRSDGADPTAELDALGEGVATVVLPETLNDDFLAPLTRWSRRCHLVVRDATRILVAPVYYSGWLKGGGTLRVVEPVNLLCVATNPTHPAGPDLDPERFRALVEAALPDLPVHDIRLEAGSATRRPAWKFW